MSVLMAAASPASRAEPVKMAFAASIGLHSILAIGFFNHLNSRPDYSPPQILEIRLVQHTPSIQALSRTLQPTQQHRSSEQATTTAPSKPIAAQPVLAKPATPTTPATNLLTNAAPTQNSVQSTATTTRETIGSVSSPRFDAAYLNNPAPEYPATARRRKQEGTTYLNVLVAITGQPVMIEVSRTSGSVELDQAALVAVHGWSFIPAKQDGKAIEAHVEVPIRFRLNKGAE